MRRRIDRSKSLAIATLAGPNTEIAHYGLLVVVAGVTYWGVSLYETSPPATLAVVTAAMLLADPSQTREQAATRLASILVGAVISVLSAHLIFPIRSRWALQRATVDTLSLMKEYAGHLARKEEPSAMLGASIFAKLALQRRLIDESRLEKRGYDKERDLKLWTRQRVMFRYLQMMALASVNPELHPELDQMAGIERQIDSLIQRGGPVDQERKSERPEIEGFVLEHSLLAMRRILTDLGAQPSLITVEQVEDVQPPEGDNT